MHAILVCIVLFSWWRHQMDTFSALLALCAGKSPTTGEFPSQRPATRGVDAFFDLRLNKRWNKRCLYDHSCKIHRLHLQIFAWVTSVPPCQSYDELTHFPPMEIKKNVSYKGNSKWRFSQYILCIFWKIVLGWTPMLTNIYVVIWCKYAIMS